MATTYGKLLLAVYELEGLLLVLEKHGVDTPASVAELIRQKAAFVAEEAQRVQFPEQPSEDEMLDAALVEGTDTDADPEVADTPQDSDGGELEDASFVDPAPEEATAEPGAPPQFAKCPQCGKVLPKNYTFCNECGCPLGADASAPSAAADVPVDEDADFADSEAIDSSDSDFADSEEEFEEVETEDEEEISDDAEYDAATGGLSLEEKLQRGMAKNMRSAFSLNDSVRFRRELFGNSQAEYNDALDMVQSMHSYGEAEEYFYDDLAWDPTNDDVKDFMEVVRKHFL